MYHNIIFIMTQFYIKSKYYSAEMIESSRARR